MPEVELMTGARCLENSESVGTLRDELDRKARVVDQTLSMHCVLRDRYEFGAWLVDTTFVVLSGLVTILSVLDRELTIGMGLDPDRLRTVVGISGALLLLASLVSLKTNFHRRQQEHRDAAKALGRLKSTARVLSASGASDDDIKAYLNLADATFDGTVPIPEAKFLKLKAVHRRKIRVSRFLDEHPSASPRLVAMRFFLTDTWVLLWRNGGEDKK